MGPPGRGPARPDHAKIDVFAARGRSPARIRGTPLQEAQLFQVNGAPREAFVPRLRVEPAEAGLRDDPKLDAAMRWLATRTRRG